MLAAPAKAASDAFQMVATPDVVRATYVSRERILDGAGVFTSSAFTDLTPVFGVREVYPHRARVRFDTVGAKRDAKVALWGLDEFANGAKTTRATCCCVAAGSCGLPRPTESTS